MKTVFHLLLVIVSIFLFCVSNPATAQEDNGKVLPDFSRTSFFLEWRGNAYSYSLNIDHLINRQISIRAGISVLPGIFSTGLVAPIMFNYLAGQETHFLELGIGAVVGGETTSTETGGIGMIPTMTIGYRQQPPNGGLLFRAGFTPFIIPSEINFFQPWGGISLGYTFR